MEAGRNDASREKWTSDVDFNFLLFSFAICSRISFPYP